MLENAFLFLKRSSQRRTRSLPETSTEIFNIKKKRRKHPRKEIVRAQSTLEWRRTTKVLLSSKGKRRKRL